MPSDFNAVKSAFDSGNFSEALQQLTANPSDNAPYYYNLGTTYLKLGKPGLALAYLEKANHLQPHDIGIQQNLQLSRASLGQAIGTEKMDPASTWSEIRGAFGLVGFVVTLFWIRSYLKTRNLRKTLLKPAGLLGMIGLGIIACLYTVEHVAGMSPAAICLNKEPIRSGPGDKYINVTVCDAGVKIRVLGPTEEVAAPIPSSLPSPAPTSAFSTAGEKPPILWRQVRYSQEGIGWIPASSLLLL
jgi:tetratricopeptide (TPR) repeat protein